MRLYLHKPEEYTRDSFLGYSGSPCFKRYFDYRRSRFNQYIFLDILHFLRSFLIISAVKMLTSNNDNADPYKNSAFNLLKRIYPITNEIHSDKFFIREISIVFILAFVGVKMLLLYYYKFPIFISLSVKVGIIAVGVIFSIYVSNRQSAALASLEMIEDFKK